MELFNLKHMDVYRTHRNIHGGDALIAAQNDTIHNKLEIDLKTNFTKAVEVVAVFMPKQLHIHKSFVIVCVYDPPMVFITCL